MDRRFWEKIIPATVIALGIALAGYHLGGRYTVVPSERGSAYVVDRFTGTVRKCEEHRVGASCADMPNWGEYKTPEPSAVEAATQAAADAAAVPAADAAAMAPARAVYPDEIPAADAAMAPR
jgi:hypothetical protein